MPNSNLTILTCAYTSNPDDWKYLRESAKKNSIELLVHGLGKNFPGPIDVFRELIPLVEKLNSDYILLTDAYDVIMTNNIHIPTIENTIINCNGLLVSAESSFYPPECPLGVYYNKFLVWNYPNGGQYVGTKERLLELWSGFLSGKWEHKFGGSTQEMLHHMYFGHFPEFVIDRNCHIFQSMAGVGNNYIIMRGSMNDKMKVYNSLVYSYPMFLHFNGRSPGIEDWYDEIYNERI